jgi:tetratricopeptide (TPR) repeat protein
MNHQALLDRILKVVDEQAYLPYADSVDPRQREAMAQIERALGATDFDPESTRRLARRLHAEGRIDDVMLHSALHVIAASPKVKDYAEAAREIAEQELAALRAGGGNLEANLASVDRHRGVLAFLMGQFEVALDYFSRAFERQRTAGNLANVLASLLRLGDEEQARDLLDQVRATLPRNLVDSLDEMISVDPDLALLR